jgi:hypothetical protein
MSVANSSGSLLDLVMIDVPCTVPWGDMTGDERVRFCSQCKLQVYNISEMTPEEAETLIVSRAGQRLCGRIHRRPDGTVMTRDCYSVRRAAGRAAARLVTLAVGGLLAVIGYAAWAIGSLNTNNSTAQCRIREIEPFRTVLNWLDPPQFVVAGEMRAPPTIATQPWIPSGAPEQATESDDSGRSN